MCLVCEYLTELITEKIMHDTGELYIRPNSWSMQKYSEEIATDIFNQWLEKRKNKCGL